MAGTEGDEESEELEQLEVILQRNSRQSVAHAKHLPKQGPVVWPRAFTGEKRKFKSPEAEQLIQFLIESSPTARAALRNRMGRRESSQASEHILYRVKSKALRLSELIMEGDEASAVAYQRLAQVNKDDMDRLLSILDDCGCGLLANYVRLCHHSAARASQAERAERRTLPPDLAMHATRINGRNGSSSPRSFPRRQSGSLRGGAIGAQQDLQLDHIETVEGLQPVTPRFLQLRPDEAK